MAHIIKLNCRGFNINIDEIKMMLHYDPVALSCEETCTRPTNKIDLRTYASYQMAGHNVVLQL